MKPTDVERMSFSGNLLRRGFWIYCWKVRHGSELLVYVGRTGDSSSPFAASPFSRVSRHLDLRENAKGSALARQLRNRGIDPSDADYELVAVGPLAAEARAASDHWPVRDRFAAVEMAVARELERRGYCLVGNHGSRKKLDPSLFDRVMADLDEYFPKRGRNSDG